MDILNNREIAISLWLLVFSAYVIFSSKMVAVRNIFKGFPAVLFVRKIMLALFLMVAYMAIVIYLLSEFDLWGFEQLKNTVFWCVSVGLMSLFKLEKIKKDKLFFKHLIFDNFKLLAIIQFVVGVYTFSLWIEVLLVPVSVLLGLMLAISNADIKYHGIKVFLNSCAE